MDWEEGFDTGQKPEGEEPVLGRSIKPVQKGLGNEWRGGTVPPTAYRWWGCKVDDLVRASGRMAEGVDRQGRCWIVTEEFRKADITFMAQMRMEATTAFLMRQDCQLYTKASFSVRRRIS